MLVRIFYVTIRFITKIKNEKVVFVISRTNRLEGNLKFIYNEVLKKMPNSEIHFINTKNKMNLRLFKEIKLLATAKYIVLDDYYLPIYLLKPRQKTKIIQLWHAAGALKKFGYSTKGTKFGSTSTYLKLVPVHSHYTHVYVSSKNVINAYSEAFNMSSKHIFPYGIPRSDLFNDEKACMDIKTSILQTYPILNTEHLVKILVAPTYRASGVYEESDSLFVDDLIKAQTKLNKNTLIIFKAHPYTNEKDWNRLKNAPNIVLADFYTINEWMLISDAFVTDYSSAIFEYALLKRPLAHYVPDKRQYSQNRGLYQDIQTVSDGQILENEQKLAEWLNTRKRREFFDTSRMVNYNFDYTNNVTSRIVEHFIAN